MLGLVEDRQVELRQIDQDRLELAMLGRELAEPLGDAGADAAGTGAADDDVKLGLHDMSLVCNWRRDHIKFPFVTEAH